MTISIDLNYRSSLWQFEKRPINVMEELVKYCHIIMGNIWSADALLGIPVDREIHTKGTSEAYLDHARKTSLQMMKKFPTCTMVANTFRFDLKKGIHYYGVLDNKEQQFVSPEFSTTKVVDRVGSGDCFMAGLIYGNHLQHSMQDIIDYSAAAAFGKLQESGDATQQSIESVQKILQSA